MIERLSTPGSLLGVAVICGAVYFAGSVRADPDLWGHLRFGGDILDAGRVPRRDTYSFTSDREWVNHEWLAEVLMYAAWSEGDAAGLLLTKTAIVFAALWILWHRVRRLEPELRCALLGLVIWSAGNRLLTFRPQVFSFLCFAILLRLLHDLEDRYRTRTVVLTGFLFAAWANLHGGWIVGLGVAGIWALSTAIASRSRDRFLRTMAVPIAAALGSLATPYGTKGWLFLFETVNPNRPAIADWLPAWTNPGLLAAWIAPAAMLVWSIRRQPRPSLPWVACATALAVMALRVSRLDMFFGMSVAWMLAYQVQPIARTARKPSQSTSRSALLARSAITLLIAILFAVPLAVMLRNNATCIPIASSDTPYPEPESIRFLETRPGHGHRLFTFFDYGEYAIWHLAPRYTVSIDGRRETIYSHDLIDQHMAFYDNPAAHAVLPDRLNATLVWLPNDLRAARALQRYGWQVIFEGPVTTIWSRRAEPLHSVSSAPRPRCFPGP